MTETRTFALKREAVLRPCGHYCRSTECVIVGGRCHCGGCINEATRMGKTLAPNNAFGYA